MARVQGEGGVLPLGEPSCHGQIGEHFGRVAAGVDRLIRFEDATLLVDQVADALGIARLRGVTGMVGEANRAVGITQKRKRKMEFLREGCVLRDCIKTDPDHFHVAGTEFGDLVTEPATFGRSARRIRFGVKP